ncbi:response regulator [Herbaspirillum sp.]|uniref:response regulator n=1 Tax=Herbaspirillum sp. TaxID=1890675 RepID=UPI001B15E190|nr:response regulator [Herbaspirillum sp.]MBO9537912.1 response regulator [Herbaspirillum sp.]
MNTFSIRLVLADDHPAVLFGMQNAIGDINSFKLVGTARNSTEIVDLLNRHPCDVLVTDYAMPSGEYGDGISMIAFLTRRFPDLRVVVMTMMDNPAILNALVAERVHCILSKSDDPSHLVPAVHAAFAGGTYYSPTIRKILEAARSSRNEPSGRHSLTRREAEVIRLFVSGLLVSEIAERLHRSKQTVSTQKISAMRKLGVERDVDLFKYALETGLVASNSMGSEAA